MDDTPPGDPTPLLDLCEREPELFVRQGSFALVPLYFSRADVLRAIAIQRRHVTGTRRMQRARTRQLDAFRAEVLVWGMIDPKVARVRATSAGWILDLLVDLELSPRAVWTEGVMLEIIITLGMVARKVGALGLTPASPSRATPERPPRRP